MQWCNRRWHWSHPPCIHLLKLFAWDTISWDLSLDAASSRFCCSEHSLPWSDARRGCSTGTKISPESVPQCHISSAAMWQCYLLPGSDSWLHNPKRPWAKNQLHALHWCWFYSDAAYHPYLLQTHFDVLLSPRWQQLSHELCCAWHGYPGYRLAVEPTTDGFPYGCKGLLGPKYQLFITLKQPGFGLIRGCRWILVTILAFTTWRSDPNWRTNSCTTPHRSPLVALGFTCTRWVWNFLSRVTTAWLSHQIRIGC